MLVLSPARARCSSMVLGWALAQAALNAMLAAITATVPDQVPGPPARRRRRLARDRPDARRGRRLGHRRRHGQHRGGLPRPRRRRSSCCPCRTCLDSRDIAARPARTASRSTSAGSCARSGSRRAQHPDFAWAWITRFLMNLGNALVILYLLYYLQDAVDLTDEEAEHGVFAADRRRTALCTVAHRRRRRHLVGPAGPPQGLRDRLRPGRRVRAAAAGVRDHLGRRVRRGGRSSASASASTPPSTSR